MEKIPKNIEIHRFQRDRIKGDLGRQGGVWVEEEDQTVYKWNDNKHTREKTERQAVAFLGKG